MSDFDAYMISSSDVGSIFDVHPKNKKVLAERLFSLVDQVEFNNPINGYPPRATCMNVVDNSCTIKFENCNTLKLIPKSFEQYNGFPLKVIPEIHLPPITAGVNGLQIMVDGNKIIEGVTINIKDNKLEISSDSIKANSDVNIEFANTGFYEVNLFNEQNHPVIPFRLSNMKLN